MGKGNEGGERLREEDLLIEVLSRLDVNTLLQCKSVCKTWNSLISNPTFIKSHLNRALTTTTCTNNNNTTLIVRLFETASWHNCPEEDGSFSLFDLGGCDDFVKRLEFPYSKGDYPFTPPSLLIGCVCGIVCVCVDPYAADPDAIWCESFANKRSDIYIWNPAIKQSKLIPAHTLHDCDGTIKAALGFGFDPIDFDFKVVRVLSKDIFPEVYSVNRNVWRKIEAKLSDIPDNWIFEICLHGFLFATGRNGMIAFNLNKEVFICDIELPVRSNQTCIADFKDSIAIIIFNFEEKDDRIKLWTLDDEACLRGVGVKASWTMMLTIDVGMEFDWIFGLFNSVDFLLKYDNWLSYNFGKKFWRRLDPNPFFEFEKVFKYTESLLPVAGSKLVIWSDGKDDKEESSVNLEDDNEDNYEESSIAVGSGDDYEESTADTKDNEESNIDSEDDNEEKRVDSGDE